jgi:hypothetical protein
MQFGPDARTRLEHQDPHAFSAVAQREHEQACAPVTAGLRIPLPAVLRQSCGGADITLPRCRAGHGLAAFVSHRTTGWRTAATCRNDRCAGGTSKKSPSGESGTRGALHARKLLKRR